MQRRKFLQAGAALATLAAPKVLLAQACPSTQADRYGYGPYYLENAPGRVRLGRTTEPGEKLSIVGRVSNCTQALPGVRLEVWQATHSGCYIHPNMACDNVPGTDGNARLWATVTSDAKGDYAFDTIKPGRYLNGSRFRPSHIHFRISTPGKAAGQGGIDLVTQLYFEGDQYIQGDFAADHASATSRIIPLRRTGTGPWNGTFNVNLPSVTGPTGLGRRDILEDPSLAGYDVAVHRRGDRVLFLLPPVPLGEAVELRLYGVDGTLVRRSLHRLNPIDLDTTLLTRGLYRAEFRWWTPHGLRKEKARLVV